ncbi:hypothetical protein KSP39_PZI002073 [Platanthera zijinensis]|uniref:Uncharacterized protein n=1 Tax=Platanthera zijinensis TaxID=2320716 RepID=A0AAP0BYI5_9ASPA
MSSLYVTSCQEGSEPHGFIVTSNEYVLTVGYGDDVPIGQSSQTNTCIETAKTENQNRLEPLSKLLGNPSSVVSGELV